MKGTQAEYVINLGNAFMFPPKKRIRKALNVIHRFVKKHTRSKETLISNEVNNYLHANSKNIPRKVEAILLKEDEKVIVFIQNGKELKTYLKKREQEKKKKEEKKKTKEAKKEDPKDKENKEKLEEKKEREKSAKASEIKRKSK